MRAFWVYDWEVYKNFACVTFIHSSTPKAYLDAYKTIDIKYLQVKHQLETSDAIELYEEYEKYKKIKMKITLSLKIKMFL